MEGNGNSIKQRGGTYKWVVAILIGLVLVICGLVVSIVVLNNNGSDEVVEEEFNVECAGMDTIEDTELCIVEKVGSEASIDEWINYYNGAIESALKDGDNVFAAGLVNAKIDYLASYGRCDEAMRILDDLNEELFTPGMVIELYHNGIYYADKCGDADARQRFTDKYNTLIKGGRDA